MLKSNKRLYWVFMACFLIVSTILAASQPDNKQPATNQSNKSTAKSKHPIASLIRQHKISYTFLPAMATNSQYFAVICRATMEKQTIETIHVIAGKQLTPEMVMEAHEAARDKAINILAGEITPEPPIRFPLPSAL